MFQKLLLLLALLSVLFFGLWSTQTTVVSDQDLNTEIPTATTTIEQIVPEKSILKVATTTKTKPITSKTPEPIPPTANPVVVELTPNFELINTVSRQVTVNILCQTKASDFSPISGTGIIIDEKGLILTNAHVAQYFLLRDLYTKDFIECVIRTGSPAYAQYLAELVYISPTWVENNKAEVVAQTPIGTGERDFAFLRITKRIDGLDLPVFSHIDPDTREVINKNESVVLVSYPAGFLGGLSILKDLYITSAITNIQDIFTFSSNLADVIAVGGTVVSQKGASGGAVVDKHSKLIGIITTSSSAETTSGRELNAITLAYINRTLKSETGFSLSEFLSKDLVVYTKIFQENIAPTLTKLLTDEITKNQ